MPKKLEFGLAAYRLHRDAEPLIANGDLKALRKGFTKLSASTALVEGEDAIDVMAEELRYALHQSIAHIRWDVFDDL